MAAFSEILHSAATGGIDPSLAAANDIYERFMRCPIQKIAYEVRFPLPFSFWLTQILMSFVFAQAIVADLLNCDFAWTTTLGSKTYSEKIKIDAYEHAMWTDFTRDMLLQISLYGFVLYRLVTVTIKSEDDLEEKRISHERAPKRAKTMPTLHKFPEVANGQNIALRWSRAERRWVPYDNKGTKYLRTDGWRMIQPEPPVRVGPNDVPVYKSFAANAYNVSKLHSEILDNIGKRDVTNTEIGFYTQMIKNFMSLGTGPSSEPWFQSNVHGAMASAPGDMMQPFETRVADRLEATVALSRMSEKVRKLDEEPPINLTNKVTPPPKPVKKHTEHVITDGREAREVTYRRAPEDLVRILDILFNLILFSWTVMPQVIFFSPLPTAANIFSLPTAINIFFPLFLQPPTSFSFLQPSISFPLFIQPSGLY